MERILKFIGSETQWRDKRDYNIYVHLVGLTSDKCISKQSFSCIILLVRLKNGNKSLGFKRFINANGKKVNMTDLSITLEAIEMVWQFYFQR